MTEPSCSACGCEAHWHIRHGAKHGKRGACSAFLLRPNARGFRLRCRCRSYRLAKVRVA